MLPAPLLHVQLTAVFALTHADEVWQLADHIRPRDAALLGGVLDTAARSRAPPRRSSDLACAAAGTVPPRYRAAQLRTVGLGANSVPDTLSRMRDLRCAGMEASVAARWAWACSGCNF